MSLRVPQKYGVLQLSYETARYFNLASQVGSQRMFFYWEHVQVSSVVQGKQHEYDVKNKHQKL